MSRLSVTGGKRAMGAGTAHMPSSFIVTLDGPAGAGKSTLARKLAVALKISYLDTGAMFRRLALELRGNADISGPELRERCAGLHFTLGVASGESRLLCNGVPVGDEVRTEEAGLWASHIAGNPVVREVLKEAQRAVAARSSLVAEGRDMGTAVFPDADCKFFLDADPEVRALRRLKELEARGERHDLAELVAGIRERDARDRERSLAPLRPADDAVIIDTSALDAEGVFAVLMAHVERRLGSVPVSYPPGRPGNISPRK
jgi:cytidylate kinase